MRPGQNNKRMRGRPNNNRKGPNPLTRSYELSGPDVKIRGTAHHIGEKYLQLARDAQSSGDPVTAESYLQHAEHYFRLIAVAQQAQQQNASGYQRGEAIADEIDDGDDFTGIPDRFASPLDRFSAPQPAYASQPQTGNPQQPQDRAFYGGGGNGSSEKQSFERPEQRVQRQDRASYQERPYQDRPYSERNSPDRGGSNQERFGQDRTGSDRSGPARDQALRDQGARDQGQRDQGRGGRGQRDFRDAPRDQRGDRAPVEDAEPNGLPAFITAPMRAAADALAEPLDAGASVETLNTTGDNRADSEREPSGFHLRPRRRRRSKAEMAIDQATASTDSNDVETSAQDPVGD